MQALVKRPFLIALLALALANVVSPVTIHATGVKCYVCACTDSDCICQQVKCPIPG